MHARWQRAESRDPAAPYARWRDGRVIEILNCESFASEREFLACAELHCQAAIAARLEAPQEVTISAALRVDNPDIRLVRLVGHIDNRASPSDSPAQGYECELEGLKIAHARVIN
jgi:hypothetical protein